MTLTIRRPLRPAKLLHILLLLAGGCASSATERPAEPAPAAAGLSMYVVDDEGIRVIGGSTETTRVIEPGVAFDGLFIPAATDRDAVLTLSTGSSTRLSFLSPEGTVHTIDEAGRRTEYTVAWSSDGVLAFGFKDASGGKGIRIVGVDGQIRDVGCSASSRALAWVSQERLVVGNADNNYVVAVNGCATISRVDARKMHEMAFNPVTPTVAYVLRELDYDRKARQYVPDSSLYVAGVDGADPRLIVGDRYKPHRPSWSPDGVELAFDARIPGRDDRRLISIYDVERGRAAYLNPGAVEGSTSEWNAHWSPDGSSIAYMQRLGHEVPSVAVRPMHDSFATVVGESGERFARWIDDAHLVVTEGERERLVSTDGRTSAEGPEGATILWVR